MTKASLSLTLFNANQRVGVDGLDRTVRQQFEEEFEEDKEKYTIWGGAMRHNLKGHLKSQV